MGIDNKFALAQSTSYFIAFVLSFVICIPAGMNVDKFDGRCLLSSKGKWHMDIGVLMVKHWGPSSACNFTIFIGVISMILALFYCGRTSILLAKGLQSTWLDAFVNLMVNTIMSICLFSTGLTVSIGFNDWCLLITQSVSGIQTCEDGQYTGFDIQGPAVSMAFASTSFYTRWKMVEVSIWCCWLVWLILSVMSLARQYRYHRQEATLTSINRETQRLLQRVGHSTESA